MDVKAVLDDRLDCPDSITMVTSRGPESTTYLRVPASNMTSVQPVFSIQLPSYATGCSRRVMWNMKGTITITGTNLGFMEEEKRIAFRQFPLQSACDSIQVQINDTLLNLPQPSKYLHGLLRKGITSKTLAGSLSTTNAVPDLLASYQVEHEKQAFGNSIFNSPFDQGYSNYAQSSRQIGIELIEINEAETTIVVHFEIHEPLVVPPFEYPSEAHTKSLFGVNTIQVTCAMANFHRMLSMFIASGETVSTVTLQPIEQHLSINYVTPTASLIRDGPYLYGYTQVQAYSFPMATVANGQNVTGSSGTIDLPVIPKGFIVYVTIPDQTRHNPGVSLPDIFFPIQQIQVSFHTKSGLLSSADPIELYNNNVRNGVEYPFWASTSSTSGGRPDQRASGNILYIDTAADLSMPEGMMPGMTTKTQFSVTTVVATSPLGFTTAPELHIIALTDGMLTNDAGSSTQQLGGVESAVIADCRSTLRSEVERMQREGGFGGRFSLGSALKKLSGAASRARGLASQAIADPRAQMAFSRFSQMQPGLASRASRLGAQLGFGGGMIGGACGGGCPPKRSLRDYGGDFD